MTKGRTIVVGGSILIRAPLWWFRPPLRPVLLSQLPIEMLQRWAHEMRRRSAGAAPRTVREILT